MHGPQYRSMTSELKRGHCISELNIEMSSSYSRVMNLLFPLWNWRCFSQYHFTIEYQEHPVTLNRFTHMYVCGFVRGRDTGYSDVTRTCLLVSLITTLFTPKLVVTNSKEAINLAITGFLWESTADWWIPIKRVSNAECVYTSWRFRVIVPWPCVSIVIFVLEVDHCSFISLSRIQIHTRFCQVLISAQLIFLWFVVYTVY